MYLQKRLTLGVHISLAAFFMLFLLDFATLLFSHSKTERKTTCKVTAELNLAKT